MIRNASYRPIMLGIVFLTGCTSMPLTTLYKLHKIDPMEADPAQIKVAIRSDDSILVGDGDARIEIGVEAADGSVKIDESYVIEVVRNPVLRAELFADRKPGENVTVLGLTASDANRMRRVQSALTALRENDVKGSGRFGIRLDGVCFNREMPAGEVLIDIFLQTSEEDGFFVFVKNMDLRKRTNQQGSSLEEWPVCAEEQTSQS